MRWRGFGSAALPLCVVLVPLSAPAETTSAGTTISNVATLSAEIAGARTTTQSNRVALVTAERLDVQLTTDGRQVRLTNIGNGQEAFSLTAHDDAGAVQLAIDTDRDGRYDSAKDQLLGAATAALAPGASLDLVPVAPQRGRIVVQAAATTGHGARGTVFAGAGDGGGDAVTGDTGATAQVELDPAGAAAIAALIKSQSVRAPDGSARAVRDAIVTYTLEARFVGAAEDATVSDPVPAGTAYVTGSLRLDDAPLSDAVDGDAGRSNGSAITVALGNAAAGSRRTVQFQVRIQ